MKLFFTCICLIFSGVILAQPFRYIQVDGSQRDSVKLLHIKSYREFTALPNDPSKKEMVCIAEFDANGNKIRDWKLNKDTKQQNQWTHKYDKKNNLLEYTTYYPDSLTKFQRFIYTYDSSNNELSQVSEYYVDGKFVSKSRIERKYDAKNHCIDLKGFSNDDKMTVHVEYVYNQFGRKIEEINYYDNDTRSRKREITEYETEREHPYGFPTDNNLPYEEPFQNKITHFQDGTKVIEEKNDIRTFNKNNMIVKWEQKNYLIHWFEYAYSK